MEMRVLCGSIQKFIAVGTEDSRSLNQIFLSSDLMDAAAKIKSHPQSVVRVLKCPYSYAHNYATKCDNSLF